MTAKENAAKSRKWRKNHPERSSEVSANSHMRRRYGITLHDKKNLIIAQRGLCPLCGKPLTTTKGRLTPGVIDHDHKNGRVRGVVHIACNAALGVIGDDRAAITRLSLYLSPEGFFLGAFDFGD